MTRSRTRVEVRDSIKLAVVSPQTVRAGAHHVLIED
jgi:hypothetical protein